jgi:vacuolar protein sorting-associated protein VTA1
MASPLGLPPISTALKPISPYLQRAQEVSKQDPIIAYWCTYYAAQLGISLKARDPNSRDVLFALLETLERMKREVGSNDALDIESVSSAYVENFALRVFAAADNEDRSGNATRFVFILLTGEHSKRTCIGQLQRNSWRLLTSWKC